jgi:hypothetical protein
VDACVEHVAWFLVPEKTFRLSAKKRATDGRTEKGMICRPALEKSLRAPGSKRQKDFNFATLAAAPFGCAESP